MPPLNRRFARLTVTLALALASSTVAITSSAAHADQPGDAETTAFRPVTPCRLFDSRSDGKIAADQAITVQAAGRCGITTQATAAAVTLTMIEPDQAGFATAWGDGRQPETSNVNFRAGQTVANSTVVPVGDDGSIRVVADSAGHLAVDVTGAFTPADMAREGRFVPITPQRIADTRDGGDALAAGAEATVGLPAGVPDDAVAVAATITLVGGHQPGHVTAYPAGVERPDTSIANLVAGETVAASVIVPVSPAGLAIHTTAGGHLLVDVTGWFTGSSAEASADGLYVAVPPVRLHDSRGDAGALGDGGTREVAAAPGSAWAVNVTATNVRADGYVTAMAARTHRPPTSTVNATTDTSASNSAIVPVSPSGLAAYSSTTLDLVVDGFGWFTGDPTAETTGIARDDGAERRVLVVSDSAGAGMRWTPGATDALRGAEFTTNLQSCRRLVAPSCNGREGYAPASAITVVNGIPHGRYDTLVMATGYNDVSSRFASDFDTIVNAARDRGVETIMWATYREGVGYRQPGGAWTSYAAMNEVIRDRVASGEYDDVLVLDWWTYTTGATHWFAGDGVHYSAAGSYGMADFLSRSIAALDGRPCPMPWAPGEAVESPCPDPTGLPSERGGVPDVIALYR